jgi:hypothetical protein
MRTTKKSLRYLSLLFLLMITVVACEDEMKFIDPMIFGMSENIEEAAITISQSDNFGIALIGLREQRIKLLSMKRFLDNDGYSDEDYTLENPELTAQRIAAALTLVEFKMDSVWGVNINNPFTSVNQNSAGIQNFGLKAYGDTKTALDNTFLWLMVESEDQTEDTYIALDFLNLRDRVNILLGLSNLDEAEVNEFVTSIKARFATMQQQYADLASEVATSPYFTVAQKELYANLEGPLADMAVTIEEDLSLDTVDELDVIDRDLGALVYFVENNYTSPAQQPLVYGEISSITELRWLSEQGSADDYTKSWVITSNIDAAETRRWNGGFGYLPIGEFSGTIDGQYHMISGLYMNDYPEFHTGLVGRLVGGGEIKNLGLVNVDIIVRHPQGGSFVGFAIAGKLSNCFSTGHVGVKGQSGAFIGRGDNTEITNCFTLASATFAGTGGNLATFAGLIAGTTSLKNCYATGLVTGAAANTNGFIGNITGTDRTVDGVYWSSELAGKPNASNQPAFNDLLVNLPADSWGNLANFPTFSPDEWEIKTIPQLDPNPRPYLKGFNYEVIQDFLVPGE